MNSGVSPTFKLLLLGDCFTGKSSFIKRHLNGDFETNYAPTLSVEVHTLKFHTTRGEILFNVWDTPGSGVTRDVYDQSNCALIMYDVTLESTYKQVVKLHGDIMNACEGIPIVFGGNKAEMDDRKVKPLRVVQPRKKLWRPADNLQCYDLSVKREVNLGAPLLWLARKVVGDNELMFVVNAPAPPEVTIDPDTLAQYARDLEVSAMVALPDDDEF